MLMSLTLTAKEACVTREWVAVNGGWHWQGTTSASSTLLSYISLLTWWQNINIYSIDDSSIWATNYLGTRN